MLRLFKKNKNRF